MSHNVTIQGVSRAGFRVPSTTSASTYFKLVKQNVATVDIDAAQAQLYLTGERDNYIRTLRPGGTATISNASPGVVTINGHGLVNGDIVTFTTTGVLPAPLAVGTKYFVVASTTNTFEVATTFGGSAINTTNAGSGTHTVVVASAQIVGLTRRGFRIDNTAGVKVNVRLGNTTPTIVDITKGGSLRVLRRNPGRFFASSSAKSLTVRGIVNQQRGFDLRTQETATLTGSNSANATNGKTVTVGGTTYTIKTNLTEARGTGTVTTSGTGAANNDTLTIGTTTYTFVTALSTGPTVPNQILRDGVEDHDLTNLIDALTNGVGGVDVGTKYSAGTVARTDVTFSAIVSHVVTLTAAVGSGTAGNLALAKTGSVFSVSGANMTGGVNPVANEIHIAGSADGTLTNISEAVNGGANPGVDYASNTVVNPDFSASAVVAHVITFTEKHSGTITTETISTNETTYTAGADVGGLAKVYQAQSVTVDPSDIFNYQALRRYFKLWIES